LIRTTAKLVMMLLVMLGCNLTARQPTTPTPPPTTPLITTLPPDANLAQPPAEPINPNCPVTPFDWITYTIEPGDSLSLLAEQTSSSIDDLVAGNCMSNADEIFVGQVIYLPRQPVIVP
jgi:hypothetical protein